MAKSEGRVAKLEASLLLTKFLSIQNLEFRFIKCRVFTKKRILLMQLILRLAGMLLRSVGSWYIEPALVVAPRRTAVSAAAASGWRRENRNFFLQCTG